MTTTASAISNIRFVLGEPGRRAAAWTSAARTNLLERARDEHGEGVISMAIAVLIVSFLGVAAWLAFKGVLDTTKDKVEDQITRVGS